MKNDENEAYKRYLRAKELYNSNEKFHTFVNKVCNTYKYDLEFCLTVKTVQDVGEYYAGAKSAEEIGPVNLELCECEDKSC